MQIEYGSWIVVALFVLRLLIPLAALLALGSLYNRFVTPRDRSGTVEQALQRSQSGSTDDVQAMASPVMETPCWEIRGCAAEQRLHCPVLQRPNVPCWLTIQLIEGKLPERCIDCSVFKGGSVHQVIAAH